MSYASTKVSGGFSGTPLGTLWGNSTFDQQIDLSSESRAHVAQYFGLPADATDAVIARRLCGLAPDASDDELQKAHQLAPRRPLDPKVRNLSEL